MEISKELADKIAKRKSDTSPTSRSKYTPEEIAEIKDNLDYMQSELSPEAWASDIAWFSIMEWSRATSNCRHCKNEENCTSKARGYISVIDYDGNVAYSPCGRYKAFLDQKKNDSIISLANIPKRYQNMSFDTMDNTNSRLVGFAKSIASANTDMGLVLTGGTGVGKTHIAVSVAKDYLEKGNGVVAFYSCPTLRQDMNEVNDYPTFAKRMEQCINADLLVLDDLGAEGYSEAWGRYLYQIIDSRHVNMRPYVITTNLNLSELSDRMGIQGERLISRFREDCKIAQINGEDRRVTKK